MKMSEKEAKLRKAILFSNLRKGELSEVDRRVMDLIVTDMWDTDIDSDFLTNAPKSLQEQLDEELANKNFVRDMDRYEDETAAGEIFAEDTLSESAEDILKQLDAAIAVDEQRTLRNEQVDRNQEAVLAKAEQDRQDLQREFDERRLAQVGEKEEVRDFAGMQNYLNESPDTSISQQGTGRYPQASGVLNPPPEDLRTPEWDQLPKGQPYYPNVPSGDAAGLLQGNINAEFESAQMPGPSAQDLMFDRATALDREMNYGAGGMGAVSSPSLTSAPAPAPTFGTGGVGIAGAYPAYLQKPETLNPLYPSLAGGIIPPATPSASEGSAFDTGGDGYEKYLKSLNERDRAKMIMGASQGKTGASAAVAPISAALASGGSVPGIIGGVALQMGAGAYDAYKSTEEDPWIEEQRNWMREDRIKKSAKERREEARKAARMQDERMQEVLRRGKAKQRASASEYTQLKRKGYN